MAKKVVRQIAIQQLLSRWQVIDLAGIGRAKYQALCRAGLIMPVYYAGARPYYSLQVIDIIKRILELQERMKGTGTVFEINDKIKKLLYK